MGGAECVRSTSMNTCPDAVAAAAIVGTALAGTDRMHQTTRASNSAVVGSVFVYP